MKQQSRNKELHFFQFMKQHFLKFLHYLGLNRTMNGQEIGHNLLKVLFLKLYKVFEGKLSQNMEPL